MWTKRSKTKSSFLFLIVTFWVTVTFVNGKDSNESPNIYPNLPSHTEGYQQAAKYFEDSIDTSANPCDDFYQYSCGKYNGSSGFQLANEKIVRDMTEAYKTENKKDPLPVKQIKRMFRQCRKDRRNWNKAVGNGTFIKRIVLDVMQNTNLMFPLFNGHNSSSTLPWPNQTTMASALGYLKGAYDIETMFATQIAINNDDPTGNLPYILQITSPTLTFGYDRYVGKNWKKAKKRLMQTIKNIFRKFSKIAKLEVNDSELFNAVKEIAEFERYIANEVFTETYEFINLIRYDNLKREYPALNFESYFIHAAINAGKRVFKKITKPHYQFDIRIPNSLENLNDLVMNNFYGNFSSNVFGNYIYFQLLRNHKKFFPCFAKTKKENEKIRKSKHPKSAIGKMINKTMSQAATEIAHECYYETAELLKYANLRVYVEKILPAESDRSRYVASLRETIRQDSKIVLHEIFK